MEVGTLFVPAVSVREMQTKRDTLFGNIMGKITGIALLTLALQKPVAADGYLGGVVDITALGALRTRTYKIWLVCALWGAYHSTAFTNAASWQFDKFVGEENTGP